MRDQKTIIWAIWLTVITGGVGFYFGVVEGTISIGEATSNPGYYALLTCLALPMFLLTFALGLLGLPYPAGLIPGVFVQFFCCLFLVSILRWIWNKLPSKGRAWWALLVLFVFVGSVWLSVRLARWYWPVQVQVAPEKPALPPADIRDGIPPN